MTPKKTPALDAEKTRPETMRGVCGVGVRCSWGFGEMVTLSDINSDGIWQGYR
ncbi:hypothetical protein NXX35_24200 [Bacteroides xylanisolvens]|nr:hypothetical protein NXX35_24200 [Bacteroides xylanisolvens]